MDDDVDTLQEPDIDFHDWIAKHRGRIIHRLHRYTEVSCLSSTDLVQTKMEIF